MKCPYCGKKFDREKEPFVQIGAKRFAHLECNELNNGALVKKAHDREALENYIKTLFGLNKLTPKIRNQLIDYIDNYHYTYSGIHGALTYFYEVEGGDKAKAYEGIGIVPYVYSRAREYYEKLSIAKSKNENKNINDYMPNCDETIKIKPPHREPVKSKQFSFLEEDLPIE